MKRHLRRRLLLRLLLTFPLASAWTPYVPTPGWTYYLEADRGAAWPACSNRFLSSNTKNTKLALASTAGSSSSEVTLVQAAAAAASSSSSSSSSPSSFPSSQDIFYLKLANNKYASYAGPCGNTVVDSWPAAGINQEFRLVAPPRRHQNGTYFNIEWALEAVGRAAGCPNASTVVFSPDCASSDLTMGSAAAATTWFHLHAVRNTDPSTRYDKAANSATGCADPFAWHSGTGGEGGAYYLACTGGALPLLKAPDGSSLSKDTLFAADGVVLGGQVPAWAASGNRWAPENLEVAPNALEVVFFSDSTGADGKHRVGWSMAEGRKAKAAGSWDVYSTAPLDLGNSPGGEIDQHIFRDNSDDDDGDNNNRSSSSSSNRSSSSSSNRTYLLWKTDDNSVGSTTTRLWGQEVRLSAGKVDLLGQRRLLMDSSGLWWVESFVSGGSLVEGPELVRRGEYYYLFFAAGKYCQASYSEGVARSTSIWGPYEKLPVPLLSTGLTGYTGGGKNKQVGPGHASFVTVPRPGRPGRPGRPEGGGEQPDDGDDEYFAVYHASPGSNCDRHAFVERMRFDDVSGWPYIDFDAV